jgi:hypothetical protein
VLGHDRAVLDQEQTLAIDVHQQQTVRCHRVRRACRSSAARISRRARAPGSLHARGAIGGLECKRNGAGTCRSVSNPLVTKAYCTSSTLFVLSSPPTRSAV